MGFPRQEYWSGLPFPSSEDLLDFLIKPVAPALAGGFFIIEPPGKPRVYDRCENLIPLLWKKQTKKHRVACSACGWSKISSLYFRVADGLVVAATVRTVTWISILWGVVINIGKRKKYEGGA